MFIFRRRKQGPGLSGCLAVLFLFGIAAFSFIFLVVMAILESVF